MMVIRGDDGTLAAFPCVQVLNNLRTYGLMWEQMLNWSMNEPLVLDHVKCE